MLDERFVILAVICNILGSISYLILTIQGKVKPNKVTWFLWALSPLIAFFAEIKQGVGLTSLMTFIVGFNPLMVFIASFINKKSQWNISKLDVICGILSLCGLFLWSITKVGNIAIIFSILVDGLAAIPTLVKSYYRPETEDYKVFLFAALSGAITLLTIKKWSIEYYAFPLYIFLICILLVIFIKFRIRKLINLKNT